MEKAFGQFEQAGIAEAKLTKEETHLLSEEYIFKSGVHTMSDIDGKVVEVSK